MKTKLPDKINTVEEAKQFLKDLYYNHESYHPEDSAHEIEWSTAKPPTTEEADKLDSLMSDIYNLEGNDGRHCDPMVFDPCEYVLKLDTEYMIKDKSGRGYTTRINEIELEKLLEDMEEYEQKEVIEWLERAELGDEWDTNNLKIIKL